MHELYWVICLLRENCTLNKNYHDLCSISELSTPRKIIHACIHALSRELKDGIEILEGQVASKLWINKSKYCFDQ